MKDKWIVDAKIDEGYEDSESESLASIEISAVRENYGLGIESCGWGDCDNKIILFDETYEPGELPDEGTLDRYKRITEKLCKILNEEGDVIEDGLHPVRFNRAQIKSLKYLIGDFIKEDYDLGRDQIPSILSVINSSEENEEEE